MFLVLITGVMAIGELPNFGGQNLGEVDSSSQTFSIAGSKILSTSDRTGEVDVHELFGITYKLKPDFYWVGNCNEPRLYLGMWDSDRNSQYGYYGDKSDENGISYYDLTDEWDTRTVTTQTRTGFELIEEGHYEFKAYVTCGKLINRFSFDSMKINVGLPTDCSDTRKVFVGCIGTTAQYILPDCGFSYETIELDPSSELCSVLPNEPQPEVDPRDEDNIIDPTEPDDINNDMVIPLPEDCEVEKQCNTNDWWLSYVECGVYDGEIQGTKFGLPNDYICHNGLPVLADEKDDKVACEKDGREWVAVSSCDNNRLPSLCKIGLTDPVTQNVCKYPIGIIFFITLFGIVFGVAGFYMGGTYGVVVGIIVAVLLSLLLFALGIIG